MRSAESTQGVNLSDLIYLTSFGEVFRALRPAFSKRSWPFVVMVAVAWILSVGRRTVTAFIRQTDGRRHWTLWYKFFSVYRWSELGIAQIILGMAQGIFGLTRLVLVADDTLTGKTGPLIFGCGWFADHSAKPLRFLWGQNWVILGLTVYVEEWKRWVCFPLISRPYLRRKNCPKDWEFRTRLALVSDMIQEVLGGLSAPLRQIGVMLVADGAYAKKQLLKTLKSLSIPLVSRLPSTAALYELPVEPKGKTVGRKRRWGRRMPILSKIVQAGGFSKLVVSMYGKEVTLWVKSFVALWKPAGGSVRVVITKSFARRDAQPRMGFFFTTDLDLSPMQVIALVSGRWPIEQAIRDGKQLMGFGDAQVRLRSSVLRLTNLGLQLQSLIGLWFFRFHRGSKPSAVAPWYAQKSAFCFADMLGLLRREMLNVRISAVVGRLAARPRILQAVVRLLRKAS
jgi:hypothetical protein